MSSGVDLLKNHHYRSSYNGLQLYLDPRYAHHFPYFGFNTVDIMLRDSRIQYALGLLKGPIYSYTKFFTSQEAEDKHINQAIINQEYHFPFKVESNDAATEQFVVNTLKKFWIDGLAKALRAIEWGFSPNQVIYERNLRTGQVEYRTLQAFNPKDTHPLSRNNELVGCYLQRQHKKIRIPKAFIHVHNRVENPFVGQSRLKNCHIPWHESWVRGGSRDVRRIWYFRNSYDGGTLYVPEGSVKDPDTGEQVTNIDLGIEIMESTLSGSYRVLPQDLRSDNRNARGWEYVEPSTRRAPDGLREYIEDLKHEYLEGLGIPPEIVDTDTGGIGSATGRKVPFVAFLSTLAPLVMEVITDFDSQVLQALVQVNRLNPDYKVTQMIPRDYSDDIAAEAANKYSSRDPQTETTI